jgi:ethanolamine utilization protein EutN
MQLGIVIGRATSTVKHHSFQGVTLLVCLMLDNAGKAGGEPVVAVDRLGAGAGDKVILSTDGLGLREVMGQPKSPARYWTIGLVDE